MISTVSLSRVSGGLNFTPWKCSTTCGLLVPRPMIILPLQILSSVTEMLGERRRRARIDVHDRGGELNPAGVFREGREHSERIVSPCFRDPDGMDSCGIGNFRALDKTLEVELIRPVK